LYRVLWQIAKTSPLLPVHILSQLPCERAGRPACTLHPERTWRRCLFNARCIGGNVGPVRTVRKTRPTREGGGHTLTGASRSSSNVSHHRSPQLRPSWQQLLFCQFVQQGSPRISRRLRSGCTCLFIRGPYGNGIAAGVFGVTPACQPRRNKRNGSSPSWQPSNCSVVGGRKLATLTNASNIR